MQIYYGWQKRGIPDIELVIPFLCIRVAKSNMEDKAKLTRLLQFLKQKINDKRVMRKENLIQLCTWFESVYRVQPDLKIHTGGGMLFGYG